MSPEQDPIDAPAVAEAEPTKTVVALALSADGVTIDHPDLAQGERLMAGVLGVADRDAMYGMLRQLLKAGVRGGQPDAATFSFMISMVEGIKPRDAIEAMLVTQMVSVHVLAMRCAHYLADADHLDQQESASRALGRLNRIFPAQIEALNRHRCKGEPGITVQNVSVGDGGKAIVGNVTQHANLIVADKGDAETMEDDA